MILIIKNQNNFVSILGWSFKKNTNDSRESSSIYIGYELLRNNYSVSVFDPLIGKDKIFNDIFELNNQRKQIREEQILSNLKIFNSINQSIEFSNIICVLTDSDEFKIIENQKENINVFDFRNFLNKEIVKFRF